MELIKGNKFTVKSEFKNNAGEFKDIVLKATGRGNLAKAAEFIAIGHFPEVEQQATIGHQHSFSVTEEGQIVWVPIRWLEPVR